MYTKAGKIKFLVLALAVITAASLFIVRGSFAYSIPTDEEVKAKGDCVAEAYVHKLRIDQIPAELHFRGRKGVQFAVLPTEVSGANDLKAQLVLGAKSQNIEFTVGVYKAKVENLSEWLDARMQKDKLEVLDKKVPHKERIEVLIRVPSQGAIGYIAMVQFGELIFQVNAAFPETEYEKSRNCAYAMIRTFIAGLVLQKESGVPAGAVNR